MIIKNRILTVLFLLLIILISCNSIKHQLWSNGGHNETIQNTILDFTKKSPLFKKDSIFHIRYYDTLHRMVLENVDDYNSRWVKGKPYEKIIAVSIMGFDSKYFIDDSLKVAKKEHLPSRYSIRDGKLFIWDDENFLTTNETISVLEKFDLITNDYLFDGGVYDAKKGVDYYFCRKDLSKYKRVTSKLAIGYYDAPYIDCN
jgi:hypothetical protein